MARISLNGFTYSYEEGKYDVSHPYSIPQTFFKYFTLNEYSVDALTNMYIYATHPNQLNDLSDCHKDVIKINDYNSAKFVLGPWFEEVRHKSDDKTFFDFVNNAFKTIMGGKLGVFSLTTSCRNEVMWAHYAQNNGFCLEFDVNEFYFETWGPYPINYVDRLPTYNSEDVDVRISLLIQCLVKRRSWSYEEEWRLLVHHPKGNDMERYDKYGDFDKNIALPNLHDRKFKYSISALKSVRLAPHFFKKCTEGIKAVSPIEINVTFKKGTLEHKVLSFLSRIQDQYPLEVYCSMVDIRESIKFYPVNIIQLDEENYRLIEIIN